MYHDVYFEYGPSLSSVVCLNYIFIYKKKKTVEEVEEELERWRAVIENKGLRIIS